MLIFKIEIEGRTAHGSAPNLGVDAIVVAASVIMNLQTYVSRNNDPLNPLVLTIGTIEGGSRFNVIPGKVTMEGTVRAFDSDLDRIPNAMRIEYICLFFTALYSRYKRTLRRMHPPTRSK